MILLLLSFILRVIILIFSLSNKEIDSIYPSIVIFLPTLFIVLIFTGSLVIDLPKTILPGVNSLIISLYSIGAWTFSNSCSTVFLSSSFSLVVIK